MPTIASRASNVRDLNDLRKEGTKTEQKNHINEEPKQNNSDHEETIKPKKSSARLNNRVAVMGSFLTTDIYGKSPYASLFQGCEDEFEAIVMDENTRENLQELINDTKRCGPTPDLQDKFYNFVCDEFLDVREDSFQTALKAYYIVLGCTELPLLMSIEKRRILEVLGVILIDPNRVLAEEMLRFGGYLELPEQQ